MIGSKKEKMRIFAMLLCLVLGLSMVIADLVYSNPDDVRLRCDKMSEYASDWVIAVNSEERGIYTLPQVLDTTVSDVVTLTKNLPVDMKDNTEISFRASHRNVRVFIDDELVYTFGWDNNRLFGNTPSSAWIIVPTDSSMSGKSISIELTSVYSSYCTKINTVYFNSYGVTGYYVINNKIINLDLCLFLAVLGSVLLTAAIILRKTKPVAQSLLALSFLSVLSGLWGAIGTKSLQFFIGNVTLIYNAEFFLFLLFITSFLSFFLSLDEYKDDRVMKIFFWCSIINFVAVELLQLFSIADYIITMSYIHVFVLIVALYILIRTFITLIKDRQTGSARAMPLISISVFLLFVILDFVRFYLPHKLYYDETLFVKLGMVIFVCLWGINLIYQSSKLITKAKESELLASLAYKDYLTGLKNRTAYESDLDKLNDSKAEDVTLLLFDMNNLKRVNDAFGHSKGDYALNKTAHIIDDSFKEFGTTYRIGGDEFCTIVKNADQKTLAAALYLVQSKMKQFVAESNMDVSLAYGYSKTEYANGFGTKEAFDQADFEMYSCKKRMKCH